MFFSFSLNSTIHETTYLLKYASTESAEEWSYSTKISNSLSFLIIQFHADCQEIPTISRDILQNNSSAQIKCTQAQSSIVTHNHTLKMHQLSTSLMSNFTLSVSMLPHNISPTPSQDNFHQNSILNVSRPRGTHTISMCPLSKHPQLSSTPTDWVIFVCFLDFKCIEENLLQS